MPVLEGNHIRKKWNIFREFPLGETGRRFSLLEFGLFRVFLVWKIFRDLIFPRQSACPKCHHVLPVVVYDYVKS